LRDEYAKYGAASGIIFLILLVVATILVIPTPPDADAGAGKVARYFTDEATPIRAGLLLTAIAGLPFLFFLGTLAYTLRGAEGRAGRLSAVAFGGGLLGAASFGVGVTGWAVAANTADAVSPDVIYALNEGAELGYVFGGVAWAAAFAATALVIFRTGVLGQAAGIVAALASVASLCGLGRLYSDSGIFAADGALGYWVPYAALVVGIGVLSVAMVQHLKSGRRR
jgi:hypothetical protein